MLPATADAQRTEELESLYRFKKGLEPSPILYRDAGHVKVNTGDQLMVFVASEESEDRLGDVIASDGWQLDNYKSNPVFLWMHDQHTPPIGSIGKVWTDVKQLLASPRWDDEDDFAKLIHGKYQRGFLKAVSVGFRAQEFEEREASGGRGGLHFKKQELVEISAVPVPAHPRALQKLNLDERKFYFMGDVLKGEIKSLREGLDNIEEFLNLQKQSQIARQSLMKATSDIWR